jgi:hypothetical protein
MQFSPLSCQLILLRFKYPPQHSVFKPLSLISETKFYTHTEPQAKFYSNLYVLDSDVENKWFWTEW